jgi:FkbM family methyltransferase
MSNREQLILVESALSIITRSIKKLVFKKIKSDEAHNLITPITDYVTEDYFLSGCWEPEIVELIKRSSAHTEILIDIGANVGITSYQTAQYFQKCILFEPVPVLASAAQFNLRYQKNCIVHAQGIARHEENTLINIPTNNTGSAAVSPNGTTLCKFINRKQLTKLISPLTKVSGATIKIDVEGLEVDVLRETHASLNNIAKIFYIIEVNSKHSFDQIIKIIPNFNVSVLNYSARQNALTKILCLFLGRKIELKDADKTIKFPCQIYCEGHL